MKIVSLQLAVGDRPKADNVAHALELVDKAPEADLILLPEIWPSGFFSFDRYHTESESVDGPTVTAFKQKAVSRNCHIHMGSLVAKDGERYYNNSVLISPAGEIVASYRKMHLFGYQSDETQLLTPGSDVVIADLPWGTSGLCTCYDLRFPTLFRRLAQAGAQIITVPAAFIMAWVAHVPLILVALVYFFFLLGMQPIENTLVSRLTPANWQHSAFGMKFVLTFGVGALAVKGVEAVEKTAGIQWVYPWLGGVSTILVLTIVALIMRMRATRTAALA